MAYRMFDFFKRQSKNFQIILLQAMLIGGGTIYGGIIHTITRDYTNLFITALGASKVQLGMIHMYEMT